MRVVPKGLYHSSSSTIHPRWLSLRLASKRAGSQLPLCTHKVWPLTLATSSGHLLTRAPSLLSSSKMCSIKCKSRISFQGLWVEILTMEGEPILKHRRLPKLLPLDLLPMLVATRPHNLVWTNHLVAVNKPNRSMWTRHRIKHPSNSSSSHSPWPRTN
jgi:hypothetical protein